MKIKFLGSGDAFGSGGQLQACILVSTDSKKFLLDCGASSMIAIRKFGVDPNEISCILISHLHGDHFGGIPFFILDAQLISKRTDPLVIIGPPGAKKRIIDTMETLVPRSSQVQQKFAVEIIDLPLQKPTVLDGIKVTSYPVVHPSGDPSTALRVEYDGKIISYTGDTEWTDTLITAGGGADLFIAEGYFYDKKIKYHLNVATLASHIHEINPKRTILTHLGRETLGRLADLPFEHALDGKEIII